MAFFREISAKVWVPLDARCEPHVAGEFQAEAEIGQFGPVQAALLTTTTPLSVHRTPKLIRQSDPEAFILSCVVRGRVISEQDGRRADCHVGDLFLRDSSRPYLTGLAPVGPVCRVLALQFPRSLLPLPERELQELTSVRIAGHKGSGALSSQFLLQLAQRMGEFTPADTARLSTLLLDVLTVALATVVDARGNVPSHIPRRALLAQIHAFIHGNLGDTRLTPGVIAEAHHISLRYLHKLFRDEEHTVAGWIRQRRLEHCRRDLADPLLTTLSIASIAARWGFTSPTHFSQAFRSAFGLSPRQFRRQATAHAH